MILSLLIALAAPQDVSPTAFAQALAHNAASRRQSFVAAGLTPIEEAAKRGRDLRRLRVSAWLPGRPPTMEIERRRDGSVTLLLAWPNSAAERHPVPVSVWDELVALDAAVFASPIYDLQRIGRRPEGIASCHGDTADFEAATQGRVRTAGAAQCLPRIESFDAAKKTAIAVFVRAAIATRPACTAADEPPSADTLVKCFP